jgi:hypothetical protein
VQEVLVGLHTQALHSAAGSQLVLHEARALSAASAAVTPHAA